MSGSSLDGIDLALVSYQGTDWQLLKSETTALSAPLIEQLTVCHTLPAIELARVEHAFTLEVSKAVQDFMATIDSGVDLLGVHGHTLLHLPAIQRSWQLVNGGLLAEMTGMPVVTDFRNQDLAVGGRGTPMAVLVDKDLFPGYDYYLNLGGIANLSRSDDAGWTAYDLCPCNQLLNHLAKQIGKKYDDKGQMAETGSLHTPLLQALLSDPYLARPAPKALDNSHPREWNKRIDAYSELSVADKLRTVVEYIATVLSDNLEAKRSLCMVTGGGAYNDYLIRSVRAKLNHKELTLELPSKEIIDYKEAILIAYAAYLRYQRLPNFVSTATGARQDVMGGGLYLNASHA